MCSLLCARLAASFANQPDCITSDLVDSRRKIGGVLNRPEPHGHTRHEEHTGQSSQTTQVFAHEFGVRDQQRQPSKPARRG